MLSAYINSYSIFTCSSSIPGECLQLFANWHPPKSNILNYFSAMRKYFLNNNPKTCLDETEADVIFSNFLILSRIKRCRGDTCQFLDSCQPLDETVILFGVLFLTKVSMRFWNEMVICVNTIIDTHQNVDKTRFYPELTNRRSWNSRLPEWWASYPRPSVDLSNTV